MLGTSVAMTVEDSTVGVTKGMQSWMLDQAGGPSASCGARMCPAMVSVPPSEECLTLFLLENTLRRLSVGLLTLRCLNNDLPRRVE